MKEKGFIFSVDALGALAIVTIVAVGWVLLSQQPSGNKMNSMQKKTQDNALLNLYTGQTTSHEFHMDKNFAVCKKYFEYVPASDSVNNDPAYPGRKGYTYCEEVQ